ncbi:AMP-binding protein [Streptacidiphilus sp. 4-A2]|nr:AMP-binding protein [Streptacidiphilus sp. 4-A2]
MVGEGFRLTRDELLRAACARAPRCCELLASTEHPHVGLLLDNTPEYVHWLQACVLAGATAVGVNPTRRGADLHRDIGTPTARCWSRAGPAAATGRCRFPQRLLVVDDPGYAELLAPYRDAPPPAAMPGPGTRMLLTFTSGSTGAPKAVVCTQRRLALAGDKLREQFGLTAADTGYACMPLFHGNALMGLWSPMLLAGGTVALRRRFSASHFLADIRAHRAGYFTYVGRAVSYLLATEPRPDDTESPLRLGFGTEAGAVDAARFEARFGCRLVEGYGSSEGGCNLRQDPAAPPGAVGRTGGRAGDDLAVVDPATGAECPRSRFDRHGRLLNGAEAIGELVNRTARSGFEGYWRNPEAGAARLRDGWYWTGDLFHRDADGWFRFAGRAEDWLRVDSENLAVADIENILARWERARAVAVYAVPDPVAGDQVMAAVEPRVPLSDGGGAAAELAELCGSLSVFLAAQPDLGTKMPPRFVRLVRRMPVTATHKTARSVLRAERWHTADPVLWRPYRRGPGPEPYRPLTTEDRERLRRLFAEHGRREPAGADSAPEHLPDSGVGSA